LQIEPLSYSKIEKDKMNSTKSNTINLENVLSGKPIFFTIKDSILIVKTYRVCDKNN
tara:strand:- start:145 stop:315 length:171 start_codon:yes stop_codon:yes gene_type:complete